MRFVLTQKGLHHYLAKKKSEQTEEKLQRPLWFKINQSLTNEQAAFTIIKIMKILKLL